MSVKEDSLNNDTKGKIDNYKISDNSLYIVRSNFAPETTTRIINILNDEVEKVGLKTRFVWLPNEMYLERLREV